MKARVKATGKIVCIERNLDYPGGYVASNGRIYNAYELELIVDEEPDYWARLEHQYAGMAMQALIIDASYAGNEGSKYLIEESATIAHALVEKYKEKEE